MEKIEYDFADVIIQRPHGFTVGRKHFYLYPITLAKMFLLKRIMESLNIDQNLLKLNPYLEAMRIARADRESCCQLLAYNTAPNTYKDTFDNRAITIRKNFFLKEMEDEDIASMMILVLTEDKTEEFIQHLGLDKERERLSVVMEAKRKHDKNTMTFNGKSVLGTFVAQLKEMGYTDNEILYEKGYSYLQLMLADKVVTLHVTDEEKNDIPKNMGGTFVDASDPEQAKEFLLRMKEKGLSVEGLTK